MWKDDMPALSGLGDPPEQLKLERLECQVRGRLFVTLAGNISRNIGRNIGMEGALRQGEGREQGTNCPGSSPSNISTRAKPRLIRPPPHPIPNNGLIEVPKDDSMQVEIS